MGFFSKTRHAAAHPVRDPIDHAPQWYSRIPKKPQRFARIGKPSHGGFSANQAWRLAKPLAECLGERPNADYFRTTHIERLSRGRAMAESAQDHVIGITLPNDVDVSGRDVDLLAIDNFLRNVVQNAVAHVDRIIKPDQTSRRTVLAGKILEHALTPDAGNGIGATRVRGDSFGSAA